MKPETAQFLEQAEIMLGRADVMLTVDLNEDAARCAYLACHHVALAYIYEQTGAVPKSHKGAQVEFFRLTTKDIRVDGELRRFLARAYEFKAVADYFVPHARAVTHEAAVEAVSTAKGFVSHFRTLTFNA